MVADLPFVVQDKIDDLLSALGEWAKKLSSSASWLVCRAEGICVTRVKVHEKN